MSVATEMYYTIAELEMLLRLSSKTIVAKMKAGEFGRDHRVVDLAKSHPDDAPASHDYRVAASAVNEFLLTRRLFAEPGIAARSTGELRRKSAAFSRELEESTG